VVYVESSGAHDFNILRRHICEQAWVKGKVSSAFGRDYGDFACMSRQVLGEFGYALNAT
jgi:hypothetical protein